MEEEEVPLGTTARVDPAEENETIFDLTSPDMTTRDGRLVTTFATEVDDVVTVDV